MEINREDMLLLTRRMTPKRTSITRIAGCYVDRDGFIDGTFNTDFLKLSPKDKEKNLAIAKAIPFAKTNEELKRRKFSEKERGKDGLWQLLWAIRDCGLKNDALLDIFYERVIEDCHFSQDYAIYLFHDRYDIPAKGTDHARLGESEQTYEYLICTLCPVSGDYEPGRPAGGFLFPAFEGNGSLLEYMDFSQP